MGSINIRSSLFGFNKEDVYQTIKKLTEEAKAAEDGLNKKIAELTKINDTAEQKNDELTRLNNTLVTEIDSFRQRENNIMMLSEKIGKLYLVSQANARSVARISRENADITNKQVEEHINSVDEANENLQVLRNQILELSGKFSTEIERLCAELDSAKKKLSENEAIIEHSFENTEAVITTNEK